MILILILWPLLFGYVSPQTTEISSFPKCCPAGLIMKFNNQSYACDFDSENNLNIINDRGFSISENYCVEIFEKMVFLFQKNIRNRFVKLFLINTQFYPKCCPMDYFYNTRSHSCEDSHLVEKDFSSFRFLRIGLPYCKMIIDYKLNFGPNLLHPNLPADDYCLDNTEDNREVIRVCTNDFRLCESAKCIHKCCPDGQSFVNGSVCKPTYVYGVNLSFSNGIDPNDDFVIVHGYTGKIYLQPLSWDFNLDSRGVFRLFDEKIGNEIYEATEETYCIEHATKNGIEYGHRLFRMYPKTQIEEKYFINGYVMIVSSIFLLLTIMFYICFGETKKLFGKTLVSFSVCLALNFFVLIYSTFNLDDIKENFEVCYTLGFLLLYGEFGTFLWLKLLCFDIYYTFGSGKVQNKPSNSHLKRFLFYSLYGWGLALVLTVIPLILFFTDILPEPIRIMMGFTRCAIEREDGNYADLLFRTVPVTILQIINLVLFYRTVKCCIDVKNEIRKMTDNNQDGKNNKFLVNKERFMLVIKLSVIMGLSYIFEVVSSFYEFNQTRPTKYLEIVWDIINCLQGVFIFLIFICKKKMLDKLKSHAGVKRLRKISLSSAATLTTHLSFDKDKKIQIQNDFSK